ncbi:hypothetical protein LZC95_27595 [Pendulispora brunnea]|uniref:Uncharacterized protein n=1 Tax=Pendulispora brunnea TaxID=2905690 RepID=A0ABZ2JWU3_9BACT
MTMYRDGLAGLTNQIVEKRAALGGLWREISPLLHSLLPVHVREAIAECYPRAFAAVDDGDMASLVNIVGALDALLAIFEDARMEAPNLRRCPDEVPNPPPPAEEGPWLIEERPSLEFRAAVASWLKDFAPGARLERWGDFGYISKFRVEDIPLIFTTRMVFPNESGRPTFIEMILPGSANGFTSALRTSIPEAIPYCGVQKENLDFKLTRALRLATERQLGVEPFDDRFWITGAEISLSLLTEPVRRALTEMMNQRPVLQVGYGLVNLAWSGPWTKDVGARAIPKAAIDTVVGVRQAVAFA